MAKKIGLFVVIILVILLVVLFFIIGSLQRKGSPELVVYSPATGDQVDLQTPVLVHAVAVDNAGIDSVEFWVDGNLVAVEESTLPKGSSPLPLLEYWEALEPGEHVFILRATTHDGRQGQTSLTISVSETAPAFPSTYVVQEGDDLAQILEKFNLDEEELLAVNPGLSESPAPGSSIVLPEPSDEEIGRPESTPPESDATAPEEETLRARPAIEGLADMLLGGRIGLTEGSPARIEELFLEVDKDYDGVFCYASLNGESFSRIPEEGFLTNIESRIWSLDTGSLPTALIPSGQDSINVKMQCLGFMDSEEGGVVFDLGTMELNHPRSEWDGRRVSQATSGSGGSSTVTYGLKGDPDGGGLYPDFSLFGTCIPSTVPGSGETICFLEWSFDGGVAPDWALGYHIYRNGALYATILDPEAHQYFLYDSAREVPFCGTEDEFYVVAYAGEIIPDWVPHQSNTVSMSDPICRNRARTAFVYIARLMPTCLRAESVDPPGLHTWGFGLPTDDEGNIIWGESCDDPSSPDDWPELIDECPAYGAITMNGQRILGWCDFFYSGTIYRFSRMRPAPILLNMEDDLVISMSFMDYDIASSDDALCLGSYTITSEELDSITSEPGRQRRYEAGFYAEYGSCALDFTVFVIPPEESDQPPPPIIIP